MAFLSIDLLTECRTHVRLTCLNLKFAFSPADYFKSLENHETSGNQKTVTMLSNSNRNWLKKPERKISDESSASYSIDYPPPTWAKQPSTKLAFSTNSCIYGSGRNCVLA